MKYVVVAMTVAQLAMSSFVFAQSPDRGYFQVTSQSAFDSSKTPAIGAEAGLSVTPNLSLFVSGGQFQPFSPDHVLQPNPLLTTVMRMSPASVHMSVQANGLSGVAGARYQFGASRMIQPYLRVAAGMIRLQEQVTFTSDGHDVTNPFVVMDLFNRNPSGPVTMGLATLGGGIRIPIRRMNVDLGYEEAGMFSPGESMLRAGHVAAAVGFRF